MSHTTMLQQLSAYVDGELDLQDRSLIESHLTSCVECQQALVELRALRSEIREVASVDLSPAFPTNVLRAIRLQLNPQVSWISAELFAKRLVLALTLLVLFIVSVGTFNKPEQPILMESYLSGEASDSTTHTVLSQGEVSKEDILLAVTTR